MSLNIRELRARHTELVKDAKSMSKAAEMEDRDFTDDEKAIYEDKIKNAKAIEKRVNRLEREKHQQEEIREFTPPNVNKTGLGDSESRAFVHWMRTGDEGALQQQRASNPVDMVIGTDAAGGYTVPVGHYNDIIARRNEDALFTRLGVRNIPGVGTTVNVPIDNEDDGEFVSTAELAEFDLDSPDLSQVAMTLVKYTKDITLSLELLNDEESRLLPFLSDFVGRGMAKTENQLLVAEATTNGSELKVFASATDIAAGEIEDMIFNDDLAYYLDDSSSVAWVTRPTTFGIISSIVGDARLYAETPAGSFRRSLMNYPVNFSNKVATPAVNAKTVLLGNWSYVGRREQPGFTVLRDPYSLAKTGQVVFHYYFRTVYAVLQSHAVGWGAQAAA